MLRTESLELHAPPAKRTRDLHRIGRWLTAGFGGAVALALGAGLFRLASAGPRSTARLADGTTLRLLGSAYGKPETVYHGTPIARRLALLSPWLGEMLGAEAHFLQPASGELLLDVGSNGTLTPDSYIWEISDERGNQSFPKARLGGSTTAAGTPIETFLGFSSFPRRGATLTLRIWAADRDGRLRASAPLPLANPGRGPFPHWQARPLPCTQPAGDLDVSLLRVVTGVRNPRLRVWWSHWPEGYGEQTRATLKITRSGAPSDDWEPLGVTLRDATGNRLEDPARSTREPSPGEYSATFAAPIWQEEPAWKVRVELGRRQSFSPAELWTVRVPLPTASERHFRHSATYGGGLLRLEGVQVTGAPPYSHWVSLALNQSSSATYRVRLLSGKDDRGRVLPVEPVRALPVPGVDLGALPEIPLVFGARATPGARWMDLTFAVSASRFVEFCTAIKRSPVAITPGLR